MLKDYPALFADEPEEAVAQNLASKVRHISEVAVASGVLPETAESIGAARKVTYHSSCHLRAAGVTKEPRQILASLPGVEFVEMMDADRCAGGAGTYIIKDYATSQKIFTRKRRAIEQSGAEVVATSCPACMIQLKNGLQERVQVKHVAQILQEYFEAAEQRRTITGAGRP
jgi:Fe-S oxidoreductase